jgi:ethanolamine utilization protein EutN
MKLARVQGTVVCTIKHPSYEGKRLMLCALLDAQGEPTGKQEVAVDLVQSGVGDQVLIMSEGNGVRQLLGSDAGPIRDVIVGVVDLLDIDYPQHQKDEHKSTDSSSQAPSIVQEQASVQDQKEVKQTSQATDQENQPHILKGAS